MGITKTDIFNEQQNKLAVQLKAIAHPARIAILQQIIKANACICGDLVEELGLAQATISQHLKELKNWLRKWAEAPFVLMIGNGFWSVSMW